MRLIGDQYLGLHLGESVRPGYYGVLGYLIMSCATLADALAVRGEEAGAAGPEVRAWLQRIGLLR